MKILVDARVGWGHGIGRVISNTVPRVASLMPDWQIDVLVGPEDVPSARAIFVDRSNVSIVPCSIRPFSIAEQIKLPRYADGYDITWFTNYWVPLRWKGRFVVLVHDMLHLMPEYLPSSAAKRLIARKTFEKVRRDATAVMFVSRYTRKNFFDLIGKPRHSEVVHLGGDHFGYDVIKPLNERHRNLVVVAASKKHKNLGLLLEAWRQAKVAEHWTLNIVSSHSALLSSINLEGMANGLERTRVLRELSDEDLSNLYENSAVLLMPSLYEGFGLPLLEGMLAGALCISSNAGAMVEVSEGAFVQFVNGEDLAGWIAAIEAACTSIDRAGMDLDPLLQRNAATARRLQWSETAMKMAGVLKASTSGGPEEG